MTIDASELHRKILGSTLDQVTKVHLFKILDGGPTQYELYLINQLLNQNERHKFVDSVESSKNNPQ